MLCTESDTIFQISLWKVLLWNKSSPKAVIILSLVRGKESVKSREEFTSWCWSWGIASRSTLWCQQPSLIKCWKHTTKWSGPITTILWILNSNWQYGRHIHTRYAACCLRETSSLKKISHVYYSSKWGINREFTSFDPEKHNVVNQFMANF